MPKLCYDRGKNREKLFCFAMEVTYLHVIDSTNVATVRARVEIYPPPGASHLTLNKTQSLSAPAMLHVRARQQMCQIEEADCLESRFPFVASVVSRTIE